MDFRLIVFISNNTQTSPSPDVVDVASASGGRAPHGRLRSQSCDIIVSTR